MSVETLGSIPAANTSVPMPRIRIELSRSSRPTLKVTLGTTAPRSAMLSASICCKVAPLTTETAIGTVCAFSLRFCAVTITSSMTGSAATLQQIDALSIADLGAVVPSVTFNVGRELRDSSIRIRGIGTDVFAAGIEPSVSTVIDCVVLAQQGSFFNDLADLQRVEVLRGPQGTLFGKNSSAGAIAIVTRNPNFERLETSLQVLGAGNGEYRANGVISAPLSATTAFRLAAFYRQNDGVVQDAFTGETYNDAAAYGFRGKLQWRPADSVDLLL